MRIQIWFVDVSIPLYCNIFLFLLRHPCMNYSPNPSHNIRIKNMHEKIIDAKLDYKSLLRDVTCNRAKRLRKALRGKTFWIGLYIFKFLPGSSTCWQRGEEDTLSLIIKREVLVVKYVCLWASLCVWVIYLPKLAEQLSWHRVIQYNPGTIVEGAHTHTHTLIYTVFPCPQ